MWEPTEEQEEWGLLSLVATALQQNEAVTSCNRLLVFEVFVCLFEGFAVFVFVCVSFFGGEGGCFVLGFF